MEKKVIATNISSNLKQVMYMHATKATKASNMRNVPFKVNEYLLYEQKKEICSDCFLDEYIMMSLFNQEYFFSS